MRYFFPALIGSLLFCFLFSDQALSEQYDCPENLVERVKQDRRVANARTPDNFTYLAMTIYTQRPLCMQFLLENGAEVNATFGTYGITALYLAAERGFADEVRILLNRGADIDARHSLGGCTPLCTSLNNKKEIVARVLIDRGAELYHMNNMDVSALHLAAQNGLVSIVEYLLQKGMHINLRTNNKFGVSALQDAALEGHIEVVKLLLDKGASVNQISTSGFTALDDAAGKNRTEIVKLLKDHGAKHAREIRP